MARPRVDVVMPFAGSAEELRQAVATLEALDVRDGDSATVVDNSGRPAAPPAGNRVRVLGAPERQSSYYARNRGAAGGAGEWILFVDADVVPPHDLVDRLFDPAPAERTAVLAGGLVDTGPAEGERASAVVRWGVHRSTMSQRNTLRGRWAFAQTASCAVRRSAFEAVGGFRDHIRSGGDADLCYRLRDAGWEIEYREDAASLHVSRPTLRRLMRQRMRHGSGAAWLDQHHPGSAPGHGSWPGLVKWTFQCTAQSALVAARGRREEASIAMIDLAVLWAWELGRLRSNEVA